MNGSVLTVLSEYGYWGEELVGPLEALDQAGRDVVFCTPTGRRPEALPVSMDPTYVDPPLGRTVVSEEMAEKVRVLDASDRLDDPLSLQELMPERPYVSHPEYLRALERYHDALEASEEKLQEYAALLIVGGSGPIVDLVNNQRLHDVILAFVRSDRPVAAECYGVACLAFARDMRTRTSILRGKRVTGHPIEYDYKDGTGFLHTDLNMGPPPYPLEYILRDATGPHGAYLGNVGSRTSVVVDHPFITARSTASSELCGEKLVEVLDRGLRRFGW